MRGGNLASGNIVNIKLINYGQWRVRLIVAGWLFRLAGWIAWVNVNFDEGDIE